jgi:hypothetical protein
MEAPIMLVVIVLVARWIGRRFVAPPVLFRLLAVGFFALGLLLVTELAVVLRLRGLTIDEYFTGRDPVGAAVYLVLLVAFAVAPLLTARR